MNNKIAFLGTEQKNERTLNLSKLKTLDIVKKINNEDNLVAKAIKPQNENIAQMIELAYDCLKNKKGRVIYMGAGTSGRIGVLDASEIYPTYGVKNKFIGLIAGGRRALYTPLEGSEDNEEEAVRELKKLKLTANDFVVGITASGRTPYPLAGMRYAKSIGVRTALITNNAQPQGSEYADVTVSAITGPEVVTGSTRMKAGTAQKLVCNMLSTAVMVKLGYVEGNYMINLVPTNYKLEQRCKHMIAELTNADAQKVEQVFNESRNVKIALIMIEKNLTYKQARKEYLKVYGK